MAEISRSNSSMGEQAESGRFGVMLPCEPNQFGDFISKLLGKPQTIEKMFRGIFHIRKEDVINTYHLVNQRITQQNDSSLIQFTINITHNDGSSIMLNSLYEFEHYNEIKSIISTSVTLTWTYLIKFHTKSVSEKQEIDLTFRASLPEESSSIFHNNDDEGFIYVPRRYYAGPPAFLTINHTERTWGVDLESLITEHVKKLSKKPSRYASLISKHSDNIGLTVGILFVIGSLTGVFLAINNFINSYLDKINSFKTESDNNVAEKINFLVEISSTGAWPRFYFIVMIFLAISLIISIFLGGWVSSLSNKRPQSHILLTQDSCAVKEREDSRLKRDWKMFVISIIFSIVTGIIANVIFLKYFSSIK